MSANLEWTVPHLLTTPRGVLPFNEPIGTSGLGILLLDEQKCSAAPVPRVVTDDVPQGHGSILYEKFKSGYIVRLGFELWKTGGAEAQPACGADLRELWDYVMLRLNSIFDPDRSFVDTGQARLQWTPSGYGDDRMYDRVELFEWPVPSYGGVVSCVIGLHTPLPYALDLTQVVTTVAVGDTELITNPGTASYKPVFKVHGAVSAFTITNTTTGKQIGYDAGNPGASAIAGGDYAEISTFGNTVFLNGDGADLIAGVDADTSEFFDLDPGANEILFTGDGGSLDVLWNPAWA